MKHPLRRLASQRRDGALAPAGLLKQARALSQGWQAGEDRFYLNSVVAQVWLMQLRKFTGDHCAKKGSSPEAGLQSGYAWRSFSKAFGPLSPIEWVRLFENLLRFANYGGYPPARAFFLAYAPLAFEHDASGEYIGPGVWTPEAGSKMAAVRVRRTLKRWCDWLESLVHFQMHEAQRPDAAERELDKLLIFSWPLVKRHNWSFADLLNIVRGAVNCATSLPCQSEHHLAAYCRTALGLNASSRPRISNEGPVPGRMVAERLFKFLPTIV